MKLRDLKSIVLAVITGVSFTACNNFLDQPATDNYNADNFYQNDAQCIQGVNYLYNSPWYDFQRGFIKVGEVLSGNYMWQNSPYLTFTVNSTDEDLVNMSYSLWNVVLAIPTSCTIISRRPAVLQRRSETSVWVRR
jgi:hypothetical protein